MNKRQLKQLSAGESLVVQLRVPVKSAAILADFAAQIGQHTGGRFSTLLRTCLDILTDYALAKGIEEPRDLEKAVEQLERGGYSLSQLTMKSQARTMYAIEHENVRGFEMLHGIDRLQKRSLEEEVRATAERFVQEQQQKLMKQQKREQECVISEECVLSRDSVPSVPTIHGGAEEDVPEQRAEETEEDVIKRQAALDERMRQAMRTLPTVVASGAVGEGGEGT